MKKLLPSLALTSLFLAAFPAVLAQEKNQEKKPQEGAPTLEQRVAGLEAQLGELARRQLESEKKLDDVLLYLEKQSQAAGAVLTELDSSEQLGFTAGINPQSRQVLLAAFRGYYGEEQKDVPEKRRVKKDETTAKRP